MQRIRRFPGFSWLLLPLLLAGGCTDFLSVEDEQAAAVTPAVETARLRHGHLLDRALRPAAGKTTSSNDLYLIVAAQHNVDKQRVMERYRTLERYRSMERWEYEEVFNGWAWQITDSLGGDYQPFLDQLLGDPDILWVEPDFSMTLPTSNAVPGSSGQQIPWSVAAIGGASSWAISGDGQGNVDVDIYVLDTGVARADAGDPDDDLALVESLDFREGLSDAADYDGHGTHVAGIAAAVDDGDGIVGVAPGARVHNLKVLDDNGTADVSLVIAAVEHIIQQKQANPQTPIVVNLSLGEDIGTTSYTALDEAIEAGTAAGIVFVVAAGNQGKNVSGFTPAHVADAITVGAYDVTGRFSSFSNWGPKVDLLAPGEGVISLASNVNGVQAPVEMSGTSMAAAHVSGAAALYLGQHPNATPAQVKQALLAAARTDVAWDVHPGTTTRTVWVGEEAVPGAIFETRIASDQDDAEENAASGSMYLDSSDLEFTEDGSTAQVVGMRFVDVAVPPGATIVEAYVQFQVDETDSEATALTIRGQRSDHAPAFGSNSRNISSRPLTQASVAWMPPAWTSVGAAGPDQRTPNLASVLQEIVGQPGWQSGNALALIVSGTGERTAESHDGNASAAPLLHVAWTMGGAPPPVTPPPPPPASPQITEIRVVDDNDDAEEEVDDGDMDRGSSDLELAFEGSNAQVIGIRFRDTGIPQGATILNAYIQFTVDETDSGPTALTIRGQDADDASSFSSTDDDITNRPLTTALVPWAPPAWTSVGAAGPDQRTPDLASVLQEIVNRSGWFGDDLVIIISGTGERTAESYDGDASAAPLLHVEWVP